MELSSWISRWLVWLAVASVYPVAVAAAEVDCKDIKPFLTRGAAGLPGSIFDVPDDKALWIRKIEQCEKQGNTVTADFDYMQALDQALIKLAQQKREAQLRLIEQIKSGIYADPPQQQKVTALISELIDKDKAASLMRTLNARVEAAELQRQFDSLITLWITLVIIGTVAGLFKKTTVFFNYDDMAACFGVVALPAALLFVHMLVGFNETLLYSLLGLAILVCLAITIRFSWISGVRWMFPVVLVTKISWGVLTMLAVWTLLNPGGKNRAQRRGNRALAFFFLLIATPIVAKLVKYKEGNFFNPDLLMRRGLTGIGMIRDGLKGSRE